MKNFIFISLIILILAVRLPALPARGHHIDEGMGIRAAESVLAGDWRYSPKNGHGPTLFYLGAIVRKLVGVNFVAFRLLTAVSLLLALALLWWFYRRRLGRIGQTILLSGLGLSSGLLFFSTYFIHESLFILLTVLTLLAGECWLETRNRRWLGVAIVTAGLMYLTKETALLTYFAWTLAGLVILIRQGQLKAWLNELPLRVIAQAFGFILVISIVLFGWGSSDLGEIFRRLLDPLKSPFLWLTERGLLFHLRPWYYFPVLLAIHEFFLLIIAFLGLFSLLLRRSWTSRTLFFGLWFVFILTVYSAIPYKTPWLIPNLILPLGLFAAFSGEQFLISRQKQTRYLIVSGLIVLAGFSFWRLWLDNIVRPDRAGIFDYAYLQSGNDFRELLAILDGLAALQPAGRQLPIQIIGYGDELLHIETEKYDRRYPPFTAGLPVYINYQHDVAKMKDLLGPAQADYVRLIFKYFEPGPIIDLFVRRAEWSAYLDLSGRPFLGKIEL